MAQRRRDTCSLSSQAANKVAISGISMTMAVNSATGINCTP